MIQLPKNIQNFFYQINTEEEVTQIHPKFALIV